jgi:hypothetical protein
MEETNTGGGVRKTHLAIIVLLLSIKRGDILQARSSKIRRERSKRVSSKSKILR